MHLKSIEYALECVLLPVLWGLLVNWTSKKIENKVLGKSHPTSESNGKDKTLSVDYHI